MTKLYTRAGDCGNTSTAAEAVVSKASDLIELLGTVDELSAAITLSRTVSESESVKRELLRIDAICSAVMCEIAGGAQADANAVCTELEQMCDSLDSDALSCFRSFESEDSARINFARTVARRAERRAVCAANGGFIRNEILKIFNRISDALFILACAAEK